MYPLPESEDRETGLSRPINACVRAVREETKTCTEAKFREGQKPNVMCPLRNVRSRAGDITRNELWEDYETSMCSGKQCAPTTTVLL